MQSQLLPFISAGQTTLIVGPDGANASQLVMFDASMPVWESTWAGGARLALMLLGIDGAATSSLFAAPGFAATLGPGATAVLLACSVVGVSVMCFAAASAAQRRVVGAAALHVVAALALSLMHGLIQCSVQCCRCAFDDDADAAAAHARAGARRAAASAAPPAAADDDDGDLPVPTGDGVPKHIAVIMDGNRRFGAQQLGGDRLRGHEAGGRTLVETVKWCIELGVGHLTAYAFSTENWSRSPREIQVLMRVFEKYADELLHDALELGICVNLLATDPHLLPPHILHKLRELQRVTSAQPSTRLTLNLCVSYGGRSELVNAARRLAAEVERGERDAASIDEAAYAAQLLTQRHGAGSPDVDLLVRTSGEHRLSNFLLWQVAYAEMVFVPKMWPEFGRRDLRDAVREYARRKRRFGA